MYSSLRILLPPYKELLMSSRLTDMERRPAGVSKATEVTGDGSSASEILSSRLASRGYRLAR